MPLTPINPKLQTHDFDTLANGMAHAIRNPLSCILTASTLVSEDPNVSEETQMLLGVIVKESKHLNQIFSDFLSYLRPSKAAPEAFNIDETARRIAETMQRDGAFSGLDWQVRAPLTIWGIEEQMDLALRQVFSNSAQSRGENQAGVLRIAGEKQGGVIHLIIEDDGPGFSARQMERAFDPFFSDTPDGTGLGLTIARAAVEAAQGTIKLENLGSENDVKWGGARVVLSFPEFVPVESDPSQHGSHSPR